MALTFLATTQIPLQQAIVLGAVLSLLLYCVQAARRARLLALECDPEGRWHLTPVPERLTPGEVTVLYYEGGSLFAELPRIEASLPRADGAKGAVLVLVMRGLPDVPSSMVVKLLRRRIGELDRNGARLVLAGVQPELRRVLEATGIADDLGPDGVIPAEGALFAPVEQALAQSRAWARRHSGDGSPDGP
ncbi:STAS domain-containing protein [Streptomyces sp. NPDC048462]|uniref:STAS domain-containing protein n=1 Tax=Streptomyces sp. NPDC048462 TaxID=3365555 RepID=UPI0037238D86